MSERDRETMIVTIDGPAGSGKSTVARRLAERLGFRFLDTGAMYRAVALACLRRGILFDDQTALGEVARHVVFRFDGERVLLDSDDVTEAIRTPDLAKAASLVAVVPEVRAAMVHLQRSAADGLSIVTEGRDQGTVVFPMARCKFFLTAAPEVRARRRQIDLERQGTRLELSEILAQIVDRDARDERRAVAPLRPADDAIVVDTSSMEPDAVVRLLESQVRERGVPAD